MMLYVRYLMNPYRWAIENRWRELTPRQERILEWLGKIH